MLYNIIVSAAETFGQWQGPFLSPQLVEIHKRIIEIEKWERTVVFDLQFKQTKYLMNLKLVWLFSELSLCWMNV